MFRWVTATCMEYNALVPGMLQYNENENKPALDFFWSFLENNRDLEQIIEINHTRIMDEWQSNLLRKSDEWAKLFDKDVGDGNPGWIIPLGLAVDSLMATACQEAIDALVKKGSAGRSFPIDANSLSQFAKALGMILGGRPVWLIVTNHAKPFTDRDTGLPKWNIPGGKSFKFMQSLEFFLTRVKDVHRVNFNGVDIAIRATKNCFGESRRKMIVPVRWTHDIDPETGQSRQWSMWDWPQASIMLIQHFQAKQPGLAKQIAEIVEIRPGKNANRVWSPTLGINSRDEAVSLHEAGCMLEERPDILEALYPILSIKQGRFYRPGMDFRAALADTDAAPDSQTLRTFRRPIAGDLDRLNLIDDSVETAAQAGSDVYDG